MLQDRHDQTIFVASRISRINQVMLAFQLIMLSFTFLEFFEKSLMDVIIYTQKNIRRDKSK
jgi:hypothetical protein